MICSYHGVVTRAKEPIETPTFKLGGKPVFISSIEIPLCSHCGQSMDFIGQIPLSDPIKYSIRFKMAYVFMCPGKYDNRRWLECYTWQAFSGANAVLLQEDHGKIDIPKSVPRYPDYSIEFNPVQEPNIDISIVDKDDDMLKVSGMTKIGGVPGWIQNNETPICPKCKTQMQFIAQISAELDGAMSSDPSKWHQYNFFNFGDAGMGFIFICRNECSENGAFLWQST